MKFFAPQGQMFNFLNYFIMVIYMVKSVIVCKNKDYTTREYFDTLEHAQQYAESFRLRQLDKFGGIFEMRPNSNGKFDAFDCIEVW